jgi:hypothetical protein
MFHIFQRVGDICTIQVVHVMSLSYQFWPSIVSLDAPLCFLSHGVAHVVL